MLAARGRRRTVRATCHLAVIAPFAVACAVELARGWRPTGDDATITYRSWEVLSAHGPLVGQFSQAGVHASRPVYDLGPLLYWLLTIPVHLDHGQGALWGASLLSVGAACLAVEAAWSAAGWPGGATVAAMVLGMVTACPRLALDPVWNPDVGLLWFTCGAVIAWTVAAGHLRWWPVLVAVASFAAQSHLMFALGSVACAVVAPAVGLAVTRARRYRPAVGSSAATAAPVAPVALVGSGRRGRGRGWDQPGWRWLPAGLVVGAACWAAPLAQQMTGRPGNLTLLARFPGSGPSFGAAFGMRSLAAAVGPVPVWTGRPGGADPFTLYDSIQGRPEALGMAVLAALAAIAVVGWAAGRAALAAAATVTLLLAAALVWTCAAVPYGSLTIGYIDTSSWPVGMAVLAVGAWSLAEVATAARRRYAAARSGQRAVAARPAITAAAARAAAWAAGAVGTLLVAFAVAASGIAGGAVGNATATNGAWPTMASLRTVSGRIEREVPPGPVTLVGRASAGSPAALALYGLLAGLVWQLHADGWSPHATPELADLTAPDVGPAPGSAPVTAVVSYGRGGRARVVVTDARPASVVARSTGGEQGDRSSLPRAQGTDVARPEVRLR